MIKHLRNYFLTGLLVLIPIAVTVKLLIWGFNVTDSILGNLIFQIFKVRILGLGLITLIVLLIITGLVARNYLGRKLIDFGEFILGKIPILSGIYGTTKQITHSFANADRSVFRKVVLIEYPREGVFSPGFLTGLSPAEALAKTNQKLMSVFIPTVPNPTTGFLVFVPEEKVIILEMGIDEAFKLLISVGVIKPDFKEIETPNDSSFSNQNK